MPADQRVTRPGPVPPPPLHLIYRLRITPDVRPGLAEQELDELPDGSYEAGAIEWVDYRSTADLPIGLALPALAHPCATVGDAALDAFTDEYYTWVWTSKGIAQGDLATGRGRRQSGRFLADRDGAG
ncbi:hypothetical protein AB0O75_45300 [Streptomyces sp. NPDC088921]|uniref:hypothetical protein n=1 Tax=unclassified Streptomyces TaxID=2593676 RepID=UPI00343E1726